MIEELQNVVDPHTKKLVSECWLKQSTSVENTENINRLAEQMHRQLQCTTAN